MGSRRPFRRQRLGLPQNVLHRRILQVGRISVFAQQSLHMSSDIGAGGIPVHSIDADVALDDRNKLVRDHPQGRFSHHLTGALVLGECVAKRHLLVAEVRFLSARACRPNVLGKLDQFFEHLRRRNGVGVIASDSGFRPFAECLRSRHIPLRLPAHVAVDKLLQRLDGEVLFLRLPLFLPITRSERRGDAGHLRCSSFLSRAEFESIRFMSPLHREDARRNTGRRRLVADRAVWSAGVGAAQPSHADYCITTRSPRTGAFTSVGAKLP